MNSATGVTIRNFKVGASNFPKQMLARSQLVLPVVRLSFIQALSAKNRFQGKKCAT
jgi:hypothetical protein